MNGNKIIKVVFLLSRKSPVNLKKQEYFVETDNYEVAHDKALDQLLIDVKREYSRYYDNVAMSEINLIR